MVLAGAGGHAIELLDICERLSLTGGLAFFQDQEPQPEPVFGKYPIISSPAALHETFLRDPRFVLGVGSPAGRKSLLEKMTAAGGQPFSLIAPTAQIGTNQVVLGEGLNVMDYAVLTARLTVGNGTLVHIHVSIHHDVVIGNFCELSPGCRILGNVKLGDEVRIGAGAVLLPGIRVGSGAVVGAGAVVTRNVNDGETVLGVPARVVHQRTT